MKSKYVDISSIVQVIGSIYNNPDLLEQKDKYFFNEEDFPEEFHKIVFGAMYNLYALGAKKIDLITIEDYLSQRPKKMAIYKANKGAEYLKQVSKSTQLAAFDYYYSRMKKMTLLRMYDNVGLDVSWIYDPDNIMDIKKKQKQEEWLDNTPIEEIADIIDKKIIDIRLKYVDDAEEKASQAGKGILELLQRLKETPEVGYPLYGDLINEVTRGARFKKFYLRSAPQGAGKALPNSTKIPTPMGWKAVGEIKEGDYLFDGLGNPTKILKTFPQGKKEVWKITFDDGREALCSKDHLWSYCTVGQRTESKNNRKFYTSTVEEINNRGLFKGRYKNILVPMQKQVKYNEKKYYIDPYVFGCLIGDGSFRYNNQQKALCFSSADEEILKYISSLTAWKYKKNKANNYSWYFEYNNSDNGKTHKNVWVEEVLKDYPELWNAKSENKFIPEEYLLGSVEQRLNLLNGLLDTDGSIDNKGTISYFTISERLKDNVVELVRSLGLKTSVSIDAHKDTNICYVIRIYGNPEYKIKLFKLKRKKDKIEKWYNEDKIKKTNNFNPIIKIENLHYEEEMTCFLVDNEEHLFLMNDYIVTHNTRAMVADACFISCNEIYDLNENKWIENGTKEPTLFITTEQEIEEIQTLMIAFLSGVDEEHILKGYYEIGEWERVVHAAELIKQCPIYIQELHDFSLQDIENTLKRGIRDFGVKYLLLDYIHSSLKILSEISSKSKVQGLREDNILFLIGVKLKDLANQYCVFIESSTQLNGTWKTEKIPDQNMLRGAKSLGDKIDVGFILLNVTEEDLKCLEPLIAQGYPIPQKKISIYKNRRGRYSYFYLWCEANLGICRINPVFATSYQYDLINIENLKIEVEKESAF